jgi:hypothetical protein
MFLSFDQNCKIPYSMKDFQATGEASGPPKRQSSPSNHENISPFPFFDHFIFLDSDLKLINRDPKYSCKCKVLKKSYMHSDF